MAQLSLQRAMYCLDLYVIKTTKKKCILVQNIGIYLIETFRKGSDTH